MGLIWLERRLSDGFASYGKLVGRHPKPFLLTPILATILLSPALLLMKHNDNVLGLFTPNGAPSFYEQRIVEEFSYTQLLSAAADNDDDDHNSSRLPLLSRSANNQTPMANPWLFISASYPDEADVVNGATWRAMGRLLRELDANFTCRVVDDGQAETVMRYDPDFAESSTAAFTSADQPTAMAERLDTLAAILDSGTDVKHGNVRLTYPVMYVFSRPFNWGLFVSGADVNETDRRLLSAKMVTLKIQFRYRLDRQSENSARQCLKQLTDWIWSLNGPGHPGWTNGLTFAPNNEWQVDDEVSRTTTATLPYVVITVLLITLYTIATSFYAHAPVVGLLEALLAVLTIGMSLLASFSLLFLFQVPFNFVTVMTPFLVLCVGIDNDYMLMSSWRKRSIERLPAEQRVAYTFSDTGPNLTITSVNDVLTFGIGILSEFPATKDFCLFTSVALAVRFLFQFTFYVGALCILSDVVNDVDHQSGQRSTASSSSKLRRLLTYGGRQEEESPDVEPSWTREHPLHRFFRRRYAPLVSNKLVRVLTSVIFVLYVGTSLYGASGLQVNLTPRKLFLDGSPIQRLSEMFERYVYPSNMAGNVIVQRAPDFRQPSQIDAFLRFVERLERPEAYTPDMPETTSLWLRDYLQFVSFMADGEPHDFYTYMDAFLRTPEFSGYVSDLRFRRTLIGNNNNNNSRSLEVESFRFTVYYQHTRTWDDNTNLMLFWRSVCANYSQYEASVHDFFYRNAYMDAGTVLSSTTLQTLSIATLSIAFVTGLLMPDVSSVFFICFSFLSIDLGVMAGLHAWGCDLDMITSSILVSILGISIYYTSRLIYSYQTADKRWTPERKLAHSFGIIGWPVAQGAIATALGSFPLYAVRAYTVRTFFGAIILVVGIGLLHGLLFMPVLMTVFDRSSTIVRRSAIDGSSPPSRVDVVQKKPFLDPQHLLRKLIRLR